MKFRGDATGVTARGDLDYSKELPGHCIFRPVISPLTSPG